VTDAQAGPGVPDLSAVFTDVPARSPAVPAAPVVAEPAVIELTIDGQPVTAPAGTTILEACRSAGIETPTLCYGETLEPAGACRVCVVEVGSTRPLAPACSRRVESGMDVLTDSERVRHSRKLVLELVGSSVDVSLTGPAEPDSAIVDYAFRYVPDGTAAETVAQPVKVDNELYIRDYAKCILCYKCVDACGSQAQNTFAIAVIGRGFDARISTEWNVALPESACVYCGNCIAVCPTGALMFKSEHDMRADGTWDEGAQATRDTICPYCGVGCTLTLHVQDNAIVKVTSPFDVSITEGNLCVKGRFGWRYVQERPSP